MNESTPSQPQIITGQPTVHRGAQFGMATDEIASTDTGEGVAGVPPRVGGYPPGDVVDECRRRRRGEAARQETSGVAILPLGERPEHVDGKDDLHLIDRRPGHSKRSLNDHLAGRRLHAEERKLVPHVRTHGPDVRRHGRVGQATHHRRHASISPRSHSPTQCVSSDGRVSPDRFLVGVVDSGWCCASWWCWRWSPAMTWRSCHEVLRSACRLR